MEFKKIMMFKFVNKNFRFMIYFYAFAVIFIFAFNVYASESEDFANAETNFYYIIQKGDTLWDISNHFFGSAQQWPGLWHENKQLPILNPHWIYPGNRIRLFNKKWIGDLLDDETNGNQKPKQKRALQRKTQYYFYSPINRIGFIRKEPVKPNGYIFDAQNDKKMISQNDIVYIKQGEGTNIIYGNYTVYRKLKPLTDKKVSDNIGTQHYITGVVKVTDITPRFAIAEVVQSFRSIKINDLLMPYKYRSPKIPIAESAKELNGKIIVSEEHSELMGDNTIAFIDKGAQDSVILGQRYNVYYQETTKFNPKDKESIFLKPVDFASLLVLHTEQTTSTVLITHSNKNIHPGANFRSPQFCKALFF